MNDDSRGRKVAVVQMEVRAGEVDWNLVRAQKLLKELEDWNPDLVVFPESVLDGYACRMPELRDLARDEHSDEVRAIADSARKLQAWILWTFAERASASVYNTAVLFDRQGKIQLRYRKVHLCQEVGELDAYASGGAFPVVDMEGLWTGVMTCFDRHFPEAARTLALRRAQLILHPTATIWFKPDPDSINTAMMRTRAYENRCFILSVNQVNYGGGSALFGPWGNVLAIASEGEETLRLHLDPALREQRPGNTFALLPVRKPESYEADIP